jgi:purine-binding chemotaxis protein CheW
MAMPQASADTAGQVYVTFGVAGQSCGIPLLNVRDVLGAQTITRIPLAPKEVAGSLNLRGRIVTAIDLKRRIGLPDAASGAKPMSAVIEQSGELYALLVDSVSEVISLDSSTLEGNPPTLSAAWAEFSLGIHRLDGDLLVLLDINRLLAFDLGQPQ